MTRGHRYREQIERLVGGATPVRPLPAPAVRVLFRLALGVAVLAAFACLWGRPDLARVLTDRVFVTWPPPRRWPGWPCVRRSPDSSLRAKAGCAAVLAVLGILAGLGSPTDPDQTVGDFIHHGWPYLARIGALAALPLAALVAAVARGMPPAPWLAGALAAGASFVLAAVGLRLACPIDESLHLLVWHGGAAAGGMMIASLFGAVWLARRSQWRPRPLGPSERRPPCNISR